MSRISELRQTHTYATLDVSASAYDEIAASLREAGYDHVFMEDGAIDMHGIALVKDRNAGDSQMSWSISPEIKGKTVDEAKGALESQSSIPAPIRDYMESGIDALAMVHGDDVLVTVTGHGHLCTGKDYDVTSATVDVRKAE